MKRSNNSQLGNIGKGKKKKKTIHSAKSFIITQSFTKYLEFLRSSYPTEKCNTFNS